MNATNYIKLASVIDKFQKLPPHIKCAVVAEELVRRQNERKKQRGKHYSTDDPARIIGEHVLSSMSKGAAAPNNQGIFSSIASIFKPKPRKPVGIQLPPTKPIPNAPNPSGDMWAPGEQEKAFNAAMQKEIQRGKYMHEAMFGY